MFHSTLFPLYIATVICIALDEVLSASTGRAVTDFCSSQPCKNEARCLHDSNGFICQCKDGFTGKFCEIDKSCKDAITNCAEYGRYSCSDPYTDWAKHNCPKHCGYCGNSSTTSTIPSNQCVDSTFIKCNDSHICRDPVLAKYCPVTCKLCPSCKDSSHVNCIKAVCADPVLQKYCPATCNVCATVFENSCSYGGNLYRDGEHWTDKCDYHCTCVDGSRGYYQCTTLCHNWSLPRGCSLDPPKPGKCCKTPNCPPNIKFIQPPGWTEN